ncbi:hypothetical protein GF319_05785 [Candidatus Bathyarchaeota archaeon]|nr:hypothetical protein [Candidatus Bathyarchaeota archaeon]
MSQFSVIYETPKIRCIISNGNWNLKEAKDYSLYTYKYISSPSDIYIDYLDRTSSPYILINKNEITIFPGIMGTAPIYYKRVDGKLLVSDTLPALWDDEGIDTEALLDILTYKVTLGKSTLIKNINHLQAGHRIISDGNSYRVIYDTPIVHPEEKQYNKQALMDEFHRISYDLFTEIKEQAEGSTILHFLSGGCDSRYIAAMYKVMGLDDVTCVSYGRGSDHRISRAVAKKLGYNWLYVDYSYEDQIKHYESEKFKKLLETSHGYYAIPYFQEYLALLKLGDKFPPENTLISTGMGAGARTFLRQELAKGIYFTRDFDELLQRAIDEQRTVNTAKVPESSHRRIRDELIKFHTRFPTLDAYELNHALNCMERHTKFQSNTLRNIEHFGYRWIFPFYDKRIIDFWSKVPKIYKPKKSFLRNFCYVHLFKPLGINFSADGGKTSILSRHGFYENILYLLYKQIYYRLTGIYKNYIKRDRRIPNELDFDIAFKYIDEGITHPELNNLIKKIRRKYGIDEWRRDPNYYLTNVVAKLVIREVAKKQGTSNPEKLLNELMKN